jgi:hypothetical protein
MAATILQFPPFTVRIVREDDDAWLVVARGHGWLHGSQREAVAEAAWLSRNYGVPIRPRAGGDGP